MILTTALPVVLTAFVSSLVEAVEALTKGILGKLLHEPTVRLKEAGGTPRAERLGDAVRTLFDLSASAE